MVKSLTGIGVAITRPADQARKLSALIEQAGGTPILFPLIFQQNCNTGLTQTLAKP